MKRRRWGLGVVGGGALLAVSVLVVAGGASSASRAQPWQWQATATPGASHQLITTTSASDQIALTATTTAAEGTTFTVSSNGQGVQEVPAASLPENEPLAAFVVVDAAAGEAIVGLARKDVAHVLLSADGADARELPLTGDGAFAAGGISPGAHVQLQALAADGSTIGRTNTPVSRPDCIGAPGSCRSRAGATGTPALLPRAFRRARPVAGSRAHGTIRWLFLHELRGQALAAAGLR